MNKTNDVIVSTPNVFGRPHFLTGVIMVPAAIRTASMQLVI
jgi:hypothetical protein